VNFQSGEVQTQQHCWAAKKSVPRKMSEETMQPEKEKETSSTYEEIAGVTKLPHRLLQRLQFSTCTQKQ